MEKTPLYFNFSFGNPKTAQDAGKLVANEGDKVIYTPLVETKTESWHCSRKWRQSRAKKCLE